jgi:hypothetical protein
MVPNYWFDWWVAANHVLSLFEEKLSIFYYPSAMHPAWLVVETYTPLRDLPTVPMHGLGTCVSCPSGAGASA